VKEIKRSARLFERSLERARGAATALAVGRGAGGVVAPLALGFVLISCGGEDAGPRPGADPGADSGVDPCAADDAYELSLIADFETGIAEGFYTNNDLSQGHTMDPPAGASSPKATEIPDGRCGTESRYAFRIAATGLVEWGAVFGRIFNAPIDVSEYAGVSMWVRRGAPPVRTLFAGIREQHTYYDKAADDHFCEDEPALLTDKCDPFGAGVGLEEPWRFVVIPFAAMEQQGFGKPAPAIDLEGLVGVDFSIGPGDFEIWVDDVSLYRAR
jgi:hypothetical protein